MYASYQPLKAKTYVEVLVVTFVCNTRFCCSVLHNFREMDQAIVHAAEVRRLIIIRRKTYLIDSDSAQTKQKQTVCVQMLLIQNGKRYVPKDGAKYPTTV